MSDDRVPCPYCAQPIRVGAAICRYCREPLTSDVTPPVNAGAPIAAAPPPPPARPVPPTTPSPTPPYPVPVPPLPADLGMTSSAGGATYNTPPTPSQLPREEQVALFGANKVEYYSDRFRKIELEAGSISWNWSAALATVWWVLFRKMWVIAGVTFVLLALTSIPELNNLSLPLNLVCLVVFGMYGNHLYHMRLTEVIRTVYAMYPNDSAKRVREFESRGGTTWTPVVIGLVIISILAFFAGFYAYQVATGGMPY